MNSTVERKLGGTRQWPWLRSLRWRLQIWHALILAIVIGAFGSIVYWQQRQSALNEIDNELRAAVADLRTQASMLSLVDKEAAKRLSLANAFAGRRFSNTRDFPYFVVEGSEGNVARSTGFHPPPDLESRYDAGSEVDGIRMATRRSYREASTTTHDGMLVRVGRDIGPDYDGLAKLAWLLIAGGSIVFAIGLAGGWMLSAGSVAPIAEISQVADKISEQNLVRRIDLGATDIEFEELAGTLNKMFGRLQTAFEKQSEFTADASHELRTPLSIIQTHQQLALSRDRSPEDYRETIETCQRAAQRMSNLVDSLLTLARLDASTEAPSDDVDLRNLIDEVVEDFRATAIARSVSLNLNSISPPVIVVGSAMQIAQVMTNLLSNAINYSPDQGEVVVVLSRDGDEAVVSVADQGPGIGAEHQSQIFDRFYRVDKQRSRASGGSGLGLSICRSVVEAHKGSICVNSQLGHGSCFEVRIPLKNAQGQA